MKKFFFGNLGLKIAAVLLSVVLWFFATSRGQSEITIDVPIEFINISTGIEMVNHNIKVISLTIKGQERLIKNIKPADIRVYVDLSKAKKGEAVYYINREDIKLPPSISVTNISPSSVKITTEETILKTVKVRPFIIGDPAKGFYVKSVELEPQTVIIEGVKSEVRKLNNIRTEPLDITGLNETFTQEVKLDLTGKNIKTKTNDIKIRVIIVARTR
jgi:YbbR domain-containing protein